MAEPIHLDGPNFARLMNELKAADSKMATEVRKALREQIKAAQVDVEREVMKPPPDDNPRVTAGTRRAIASGLSTRIGTGKSPAVRISASSKNLPANRKRMLRLYNKAGGWRHPVFARGADGKLAKASVRSKGLRGALGGTETPWVAQMGRPYFGAVLKRRQAIIEMAIFRAMDDAHRRLISATTD
jgi:hypothetical protein